MHRTVPFIMRPTAMLLPRSIAILVLVASACVGGRDGAERPRLPGERTATEPAHDEPAARFAKPRPPCVDEPFVESKPRDDDRWSIEIPKTTTTFGAVTCA